VIPKTVFYDAALNHNPYPYNPKAGEKLLEKHGYKLVHGVLTRNNKPLVLTLAYPSGVESELQEVQLMKSDWAAEGIDVNLHPMEADQLESITYTPSDSSKWEMSTGLAWFYDGPGYWPTGGQLFATKAPSGFGYSNQKEDQLLPPPISRPRRNKKP
jgi:peptide/nickel transport system substrate-binding protein